MDKSTPRPWAVGTVNPYEDEPDEISILSASGYCVAIAIPQGTERDEMPARTQANAALIVRSVNAFDALVEALQPFVEEFERHIERYLRRGDRQIMQGNFDRMPDRWPVAKFQITMGQCRVARAALALAKETP